MKNGEIIQFSVDETWYTILKKAENNYEVSATESGSYSKYNCGEVEKDRLKSLADFGIV